MRDKLQAFLQANSRRNGGPPAGSRPYWPDQLFLSQLHAIAISVYRTKLLGFWLSEQADRRSANVNQEEEVMKVWTKPAVREQEVGLEVTSYLPAEIDII
jgi:coenzyme PQQ precursor peptide PqqA